MDLVPGHGAFVGVGLIDSGPHSTPSIAGHEMHPWDSSRNMAVAPCCTSCPAHSREQICRIVLPIDKMRTCECLEALFSRCLLCRPSVPLSRI